MKTTRITAASLSLLMLATLYVPAPALAATCSGHTDDASIDCNFSCQESDQVSVSVTADDQSWGTARAIGSATCGNVAASCNEPATCTDTADELTTEAQEDGECHAETDEIWHDGFSYECKAVHMCPPPCGGERPEDIVKDVLNQLCALVPWACTPSEGIEYVGTAASAAVAYAGEMGERCRIVYQAAASPDMDWAERQLLQTKTGLEDCGGMSAQVDPVTGLPADVRSLVKVRIKGDQALGQVCNAGVGCHFVLPTCDLNAAGIIRGCTVGGSSVTVQPSENLKALLGF